MIFDIISKIPSVCESLKSEALPIFLYGMGNGAEKIYAYLCRNGIEISGVVASDGFVRGQSFLGHEVVSISEAEEKHGRLCLVICFGTEGEKSRFFKGACKKAPNSIAKSSRVWRRRLRQGIYTCQRRPIRAGIRYFGGRAIAQPAFITA